MRVFDLDFRKLVVLLLPTFLRKPRSIAWLQVLIAPLEQLQYEFKLKRHADIIALEHNGQKCYLRKILNDNLDNELRRIRIEDMLLSNALYIFTEGENAPLYLSDDTPIYLHTESEMQVSGVNFSVHIPLELRSREVEVRALIDTYKLASKRYNIQYE